ncbi:ferredoxin [Nonomuraea jiangxiensis]|uniref:Ferredoxin n=1 Tax=Nonomuraea jiangxiensis TaxID=633440 RepID=A0A1G8HA03_9ACTN|nr:ferredoxin [Nonomuraea jiangxiensis]SDI03494.1 ferredoxin [Nonomuraea jiangxiensis]
MEIKADTTVCIGAGMCALTVPAVFDQSEDEGTVLLLQQVPPADLEDAVRRAVTLCPSGAISIS